MATIGLIGGLGPESTIDYYRRLLERWREHAPGSAPSIIIDSLDVDWALRLVASDRSALTAYLAASARRLVAAGADFIAMTANTPHVVFDAVAAGCPVPIVSIVDVCAREAVRRRLSRLLVLGTRFTMEAPFYPEVLGRHGIQAVVPAESDRAWIHTAYVDELLRGHFREETRARMCAFVEQQRDQRDIDGIILAGTELPLLLKAPAIAGLPVLDTTALHVDAIVGDLRRRPRIRYATAADADLLARIGAETFSDTFAAVNTPADMAEYLAGAFGPAIQARELADPQSTFLLAELDGETVGYARIGWASAPPCITATRPLDIARFYARKPWVGAGVGAAMMQACLAEARQRQCDVIWLAVWEHNERAKAFYSRWGFREVGDQVFVLGSDPQRDLVLQRPVQLSHS